MTGFRSGNGSAWLDLLSTLSGRYRTEQEEAFDRPARLRDWLRGHGLEPASAVTEADLRGVREVREALHRAAAAAVRGGVPAGEDVRRLDRALASDQPLRLLQDEAGLAVGRPATTAEALARLVRDAVQDLAGPRREHLRFCGDDTCSGIFLDPTGRRRWCTDQACGNRLRVRAHRNRVREG